MQVIFLLISYIKILVVRPSVCDGCGRGRNRFAGHVQNHHVRFSFHVHRTILIFHEIVKTAAKLLLQVLTLCVASYVKDAIVGAYHRTSDGQVHKIIWRAGLERDTIFHRYVSQRASSKAATVTISLGSFTVAGDLVLQLIRLESLRSELEES